jgi:glycine/D-amino acid oxidase-like deaminating enzyme
MRIIIIGAGLFGSLIARGLFDAGYHPLILDDQHALRGSAPAACLIKKEWCGKLPAGVYEAGMRFLHNHFLISKVDFGPKGKADWVDPRDMLLPGLIGTDTWGFKRAMVQQVLPRLNGGWVVGTTNRVGGTEVFTADKVIVAAGYWSQALVPDVPLGLTGKSGSAVLFEGRSPHAFIKPWAPYKQIVGFDRGDGYWIGDGSAILAKNYDTRRQEESVQRCLNTVRQHPLTGEPGIEDKLSSLTYKVLTGIRPYTDKQPCWCDEVKPGLWVAVGARKNGTLLGAWCAQKIVSEI